MRVGQISMVISVDGSHVLKGEMAAKGISPGATVEMLDPEASPMKLKVNGTDTEIGKAIGGKIKMVGI